MTIENHETWTLKDHGHLKPHEIPEDVYFMDICRVVWEKGTCDRGRSGCVIVKDEQIISTGYVETEKPANTVWEIAVLSSMP